MMIKRFEIKIKTKNSPLKVLTFIATSLTFKKGKLQINESYLF